MQVLYVKADTSFDVGYKCYTVFYMGSTKYSNIKLVSQNPEYLLCFIITEYNWKQ